MGRFAGPFFCRVRTINNSTEMQRQAKVWRSAGQRVVLVPTMGALHEGHRSLIRLARKNPDLMASWW